MPKADSASTKKSPKVVEWESVEREYCAGLLSIREIASIAGVSHVAVMKRAKRDCWDRDLAAKIKARAESLVTSAAVTRVVTTENAVKEREVVEANAEAIMRVRLTHRKDIARARKLAISLLAELEQTAEAIPLIERLEELVCADAGLDGTIVVKRHAQLKKVLELSTRTATMKTLADIMTKLIALEREAYSLATVSDKEPEGVSDKEPEGVSEQLAELLRQIDGAGTGLPAHVGTA